MESKRYGEIRFVLIYVLFLNLAVAVAKLVFGFMANSLSMIADSLHSFFDSTSNIIGLVAIKISAKPPDSNHPYGHSKYETLATIGIAALVFMACFEIVEGAVNRLRSPVSPDIELITFTVMFATLFTNILVSRYEKKRGEELKSPFLVADAMHTRTDVFASSVVIVGFLAVKLGYPIIDPIAALFIAFLIGKMGYSIVRESSDILCDTSIMDEDRIRRVIHEISGVIGCHKIRTRGSESEVYVDLHLVIDPKISVAEGHEISKQVEMVLKEKLKEVKDVVVHIEPR